MAIGIIGLVIGCLLALLAIFIYATADIFLGVFGMFKYVFSPTFRKNYRSQYGNFFHFF